MSVPNERKFNQLNLRVYVLRYGFYKPFIPVSTRSRVSIDIGSVIGGSSKICDSEAM